MNKPKEKQRVHSSLDFRLMSLAYKIRDFYRPRRRILEEDLQRVIQHAEACGDKLFHPPSGRYKAAYAPFKVTFWVEYAPEGNGFRVFNAYSHRMNITGVK